MFSTKVKQTFNRGTIYLVHLKTNVHLYILPQLRHILKSVCSGWSHSGHSLSLRRHSRRHRRTWRRKSVCLSHTRCANEQPERASEQNNSQHLVKHLRNNNKLCISHVHSEKKQRNKFVLCSNSVQLPPHCWFLGSSSGAKLSRENLQPQTEATTHNDCHYIAGWGLFWIWKSCRKRFSHGTHQARKRSNVQRVYPASVGVDLRVQNSRHCLVNPNLTCSVTCHHGAFPQFDRWAAHADGGGGDGAS